MNNCWFRVKTNVAKPHKGEIGIVFEHPTQPANQPGGWMVKEKHLEKSLEKLPTFISDTAWTWNNKASRQKMYNIVQTNNNHINNN